MAALEILDNLLKRLVEKNGSDLHIKSDAPVRARVNGEIVTLSDEKLSGTHVEAIARGVMGARFADFEREYEFDTAYVLDAQSRFRVNLYYQLDGIALVFRLIPSDIKSFEELNLPSELNRLVELSRGLVLITGTTGSGKTTTLATVIEQINKTRPLHIITVEDPIEFVHNDDRCIIEQRGIGLHASSFAKALRAALREDPDIIVVGELRDLETAEIVMQAVNTGHLVFATVHTLDARETIDRMIALFPTKEQNRVRMDLATNIEAVISQRLLRGKSGEQLPAVEMMFRSPRIEFLILNKRDHEIPDAMMQERNSFGSVTFNAALFDLVLQDKISEETALSYATSPSDLKLLFTTSSAYQEKIGESEDASMNIEEVTLK
jgi:twitching motility protein PilT